MKREDHILWKIAKANEVVTELQFARNRGQLDKHEYAAKVAPICMEVMNRLLQLIEQDGFIEIAEYNAQFFDEEKHHALTYQYTADWIMRDYKKFIQTYRNAIFEPDPVKRASELVLGMDSLENWMHRCWFISGQVMRASPITGNYEKDYTIALHTMYLLYAKGINETFEYLESVIPAEF